MSTTIDSLQIDIQSSSSNAAKSIEDLTSALTKLKQVGSFGVAIKHLNTLRDTLQKFTSVSSNANKISAIAKALQEFKNVGSIPTLSGVGKLAEGLKSLSKIDIAAASNDIQSVANMMQPLSGFKGSGFSSAINALSKIQTVVKGLDASKLRSFAVATQNIGVAMAPLSGFKGSGFSNAINALGKIKKVSDQLDDNTLEEFSNRVQRLVTILTPLSTQMTTIQAGLKGINSASRSVATSVKQVGTNLNATSINLSSFIYNVRTAINVVTRFAQKLADVIAEAIEWDGIESRFDLAYGNNAAGTYDWIQRLGDEMGLNTQQFMQAVSLNATMLEGFGVRAEDAQKMALGYTELTYDIWAGVNDKYKSFQSAADAVASAIAGEVEPIRRAGLTITEATLQETAANHGLTISLENATEAQKSYLRYLAITDAAMSRGLVGTYAREMDTAEGAVRTLSQQLRSLTQAFGSLFLPILIRVVPWLQAFVELLTEAVHWVAELFGVEIQAVEWSNASTAVGNIGTSADGATDSINGTTEALKDLKNATLGIDELNVISPNTTTGGGGSSGGYSGGSSGVPDVDSLWNDALFESVDSKVDEIKKKIKDHMAEIEAVIGACLLGLGAILAFTGANVPLGIGLMATGAITLGEVIHENWDTILKKIKPAINEVTKFLEQTGLLALGALLCATGVGIPLGLSLINKALGERYQDTAIMKGTRALGDLIADAWKHVEEEWNNKQELKEYTPPIVSVPNIFKTMWQKAKSWWNNDKGNLHKFTPEIGNIKIKLTEKWQEARKWWNESKAKLSTYLPSIGSIKNALKEKWQAAKDWWNKVKVGLSHTPVIGNIKTALVEKWNAAKTWWNKVKTGLKFTPIVGSIRDALSSAWDKAKTWWKTHVRLSIPSLSFKVTYEDVGGFRGAIVKALGLAGWPKLSFAASGGMFDMGSLIWAGERGAEVVANAAGGKTGVMNVQQMSDAVYEGVYSAVMAAMRNSNGNSNQSVNVYLDGKQVTSVVEQRQRERGATLMGSQVYTY